MLFVQLRIAGALRAEAPRRCALPSSAVGFPLSQMQGKFFKPLSSSKGGAGRSSHLRRRGACWVPLLVSQLLGEAASQIIGTTCTLPSVHFPTRVCCATKSLVLGWAEEVFVVPDHLPWVSGLFIRSPCISYLRLHSLP
jgi:hypothetical protein